MNPFDDEDRSFLVVANDEGQHALWPGSTAVCAGWDVRHGPADRAACLAYIRANWPDIRPRSLVARAASSS